MFSFLLMYLLAILLFAIFYLFAILLSFFFILLSFLFSYSVLCLYVFLPVFLHYFYVRPTVCLSLSLQKPSYAVDALSVIVYPAYVETVAAGLNLS